MGRSTHTYALLTVSSATYHEIKQRLMTAGYDHAFHDNPGDPENPRIDMHGIALIPVHMPTREDWERRHAEGTPKNVKPIDDAIEALKGLQPECIVDPPCGNCRNCLAIAVIARADALPESTSLAPRRALHPTAIEDWVCPRCRRSPDRCTCNPEKAAS